MKTRLKVILALSLACGGTLLLATGCGGNQREDIYKDRYEEGYGVTVRFDANGGQFAGTSDTSIVDVFRPEEAKKGVKLLEPGDTRRGPGDSGGAAKSTLTARPDFFFAGWYRERTPMTDQDGNLLDVYGDPVEYEVDANGNLVYYVDKDNNVMHDEEGNPIPKPLIPVGYTYSGLWDFTNDRVSVSEDWTYPEEVGQYDLTLYAGWLPQFVYSFRMQNEKGEWEECGKYSYNPVRNPAGAEISVPYWNESTGTLVYGYFPELEKMSFVGAYEDENCNRPCEGTITHDGVYNEAKATVEKARKIFYLKYRAGDWFRLYAANQFFENYDSQANYELMRDLDFSAPDVYWPSGASTGTFIGSIHGNGHSFKNVSLTFDSSVDRAGLFGTIAQTAVFEDVSFENITVTLGRVGQKFESEFGLFAGRIERRDNPFKNVSVTGALLIGQVYPPEKYGETKNYQVGLLSGNYEVAGITYSIQCDPVDTGNEERPYPYYVIAYLDDGEVDIFVSDDATKKVETQYLPHKTKTEE